MEFPKTRMRRNRQHEWLRKLNRESCLSADDLILPLFVHSKENNECPILELSNIKRYSIDSLLQVVESAQKLGINAIALFPVIDHELKNNDATEAFNPENLICRSIKKIKEKFPNLGIIADVALDPYTIHGHDGIVINGYVNNDATISVLCKQASVLASAGCDIVAPSDMMDGRVNMIREFLDSCDYNHVCILSYAVKYASCFYSPFRSVVGSAQSAPIDKSTYQMDIANSREAMREIEMDINEGADSIMIKPGMPYLDIISLARSRFDVPIFAYQVSGEYAMIRSASKWINYEKAILESMMCFKRAGADAIVTYAAMDVARLLS